MRTSPKPEKVVRGRTKCHFANAPIPPLHTARPPQRPPCPQTQAARQLGWDCRPDAEAALPP
eukprot:4419375-Alexandrium_andersonii.AAC.1